MVQVGLGVLAAAVAIAGLAFLRNSEQQRMIPPVESIVLANRPPWIDEQTAKEICRLVSEIAAENPNDPHLPAKAADALTQSIWVKRVLPGGIVNDYNGVLSICCEFRKPIAIVGAAGVLVRVDEDGLVLPGRFLRSGVVVGQYKEITGVRSTAPEEGQIWDSPDLLSAIQILRLINERPYSPEIATVDVRNYNGRRDSSRAHIVLLTDQHSALQWGRAIGTEGRIEVDYKKKLEHIEGLFLQYGSLNKLEYADLRGKSPLGRLRNGGQVEPR